MKRARIKMDPTRHGPAYPYLTDVLALRPAMRLHKPDLAQIRIIDFGCTCGILLAFINIEAVVSDHSRSR
jgi:hypothetical protein